MESGRTLTGQLILAYVLDKRKLRSRKVKW